MPKQTLNYKLPYVSKGEPLDEVTESRRFNAIDAQLRGLFEVIGDGVIDGWLITKSTTSGDGYIDVSPGTGVVNGVAAATTTVKTVGQLVANTTMYIFAKLRQNTYWTREVDMVALLSSTELTDHVLIGAVTTDGDGIVEDIDQTGRTQIGLLDAIRDYIKGHRHVGGTENPPQIDLESEVSGYLGQGNIPELDASKVSYGVLDPARIENVDHNTQLTNTGMLTHAQLDTFAEQISNVNATAMGEIAVVNFLQLVLALKHQWPDVDEYLLNLIAFIPGISPDSFIDTDNTTAEVDTRTEGEGGTHTITGAVGPSFTTTTKTWDSAEDYVDFETTDVSVDSDVIILGTTEISATIDEFDDVSSWVASVSVVGGGAYSPFTEDAELVYSGEFSGKLDYSPAANANLSLVLEKTFSPQDWSAYNTISFLINTESIEHGDLYFYLRDADIGVQNSYTLILPRNQPSINRETLVAGWREIQVDISGFERSSITAIGIRTSSDKGWDAAKPFTLNVDLVKVTSGIIFSSSGYTRFVYGNGVPSNFTQIRSYSNIPSGCVLQFRTRLANDLSDFDDDVAIWSSYSTGDFSVYNPSAALWGYIQIEAYFETGNGTTSPTLSSIFLDISTSSDDREFSYDSQTEWESGVLTDIDSTTTPGTIRAKGISDTGTYLYASGDKLITADSDFVTAIELSGNTIPRSYKQAVAEETGSFGRLSAVRRAPDGTFVVCDPENDRVVHIDSSGTLLTGFYGAFSEDPYDGYGTEDNGPGSNKNVEAKPDAEAEEPTTKIKAVMSVYNSNLKTLYVAFDRNIQPVHLSSSLLNENGFYVKFGAFKINIGRNAEFSLLGIDPDKFNGWASITSDTNPLIDQFTFDSNVLCIRLSDADAATLSSVSGFALPSIVISSPYERYISGSDTVTVRLSVGSFTMTEDGRIRYKVDNGSWEYTSLTDIELSGLSEGDHTFIAQLVDINDNPLSNQEALATVEFVVDTDSSNSEALIQIVSPLPNQVMPASFSAVVQSINHPVIDNGSHLQWKIDSGDWTDTNFENISMTDIEGGRHTLYVRAVSADGTEVDSSFSMATVVFYSGASTVASMQLKIDRNSVYGTDLNKELSNADTTIDTDIANIYFQNIFCPIDVQLLGTLSSNGDSLSYLIAKGRSPSYTTDMAAAPTNTSVLVETPEVIYQSLFLSGHSVVEYSRNGELIFSNNAAKFIDTSDNAFTYLGSVQKISADEIIMADGINSRAIISTTSSTETAVVWEYESDRIVSDFKIAKQQTRTISVTSGDIDERDLSIRIGTTVLFRNDSAEPIRIVSGKTTPDLFEADPDIDSYGDDFLSDELQAGEVWSHTFSETGVFDWFVSPTVLTGKITCTQLRVSPSDTFYIVERSIESPLLGGRVIQVDAWGNVLWSLGDGYLYDPVDVEPMSNGHVIISS